MKSLKFVITLLTIITTITRKSFHGFVEGKFVSGFTLDELTNGDATYQPISFGSHSNNRYVPSSLSLSPSSGNLLASQQVAEQARQHLHQPNGNHNTKEHVLGERKTCPPTKPFRCPSDDPQTGDCVPIQYICDGSPDCPPDASSPGGYDEDPFLCTAAKRPPVEETANFLRTLIANHGAEYIEKLFGPKVSQVLMPLGGPERVAIALSVSKTIDDFGKALHLMRGDIDHLRNVLVAIQTADEPMLKSLGIVRNSELADMKFFLEKLLSTGFLD